ncbi:MAG: hypothetical protein DI533_07455 [Cereibacter sphaeroides]|uniref:Membrane-associated oxidoreductase n=1 Tax=Cereibacter sphaeroides TaxID=1063 RepID=A0A2W5SDZ4_CERSP|nr:MAG: hypothetical protein DI533_07455 [Cereibacter sphaeroides]
MADSLSARFGPLGKAEMTLIAGLGTGVSDRVGAGGLPAEGDEDRRVRADLVRFVLLGGPDAPSMHEKGLRLSGAWITGTLDLEGCRIPRDIGLLDCRFEATPVLRSAVIDTLSFDGSHLPGFAADRLEARGDLLFRAATVEGPISLRGGRIGGDLAFDGAALTFSGDRALQAERISVRGSALFRGAAMRGGLHLTGARIGGDLDLVGASLDFPGGDALDADTSAIDGDLALRLASATGTVTVVGARIGGDVDLSGVTLSNPGALTFNLNRSTATGALFLRDGASVDGTFSLNGATLGAIVDDPASWPKKGDLRLNRCLYGSLLGAAVSAEVRLEWLARQTPDRWGEDFWPQPYEQLARVLGEMGHDEDKRRVLMEKERLSRRARRGRARNAFEHGLLRLSDTVVGLTTGYGRQPLLALVWIVMLWMVGAVYYSILDQQQAVRPNSPVVLRSPEWVLCAVPRDQTTFLPSLGTERAGLAADGQPQLGCWRRQPEASAYPRFNPLMLSADAIFPGLGTGQKDTWSPDTRQPIGYVGKWFMYFQTLAGLALGLLAVAGFSGIVKSN